MLELAVGTGRNLPHYPPDVTITGIDLSEQMLAIGRRRAEQLGREADLRLGDAQAAEFPEESFDTVVCTLALCTIPDPRRAVAEGRRVLRPGGCFLLLEHVRSPILPVRLIEQLLDPIAVRLAADHLAREPLDLLTAEASRLSTSSAQSWASSSGSAPASRTARLTERSRLHRAAWSFLPGWVRCRA